MTIRNLPTWRLPEAPPSEVAGTRVDACVPGRGPRIVFSALDANAAKDVEPAFARAGHIVISNARSFRMDTSVPLLIPEINPEHLALLPRQRREHGWPGAIVTNPNCSTVVLSMVLAPLRRFGLRAVNVATLQAVSGAGYPGVSALDAVDAPIVVIGAVLGSIYGGITGITEAAGKLIEEPTVAVVVKQINSRKVFITGQVAKPGPYPLNGPTTVVQLLAIAGGVLEYADDKNIAIMRTENGKPVSLRFNYDQVKKRKNLEQNIQLKPGDTITKFNDTVVKSVKQFRKLMEAAKPGDKVKIAFGQEPGAVEPANVPLSYLDTFALDGGIQGLDGLAKEGAAGSGAEPAPK